MGCLPFRIRVSSRNLKIICLLLIAVLAVPSIGVNEALADGAKMNIQILESGEVRIWEESSTATDFDTSLNNLAYPVGAMMVHLEPIITLLGIVLVTEDGSSPLNISATESFIANPPSSIARSVRAVIPLTHIVDPDGTIEQRVVGRAPTLREIRRWFARLSIQKDAEELLSESESRNIEYLQNWLDGAKYWANHKKEELYEAHPALGELNLVEAFSTRTVTDLMEYLVISEKLYDLGAINAAISSGENWISYLPLGIPSSPVERPLRTVSLQAKATEDVSLGQPIGASNGAALTYTSKDDSSVRKCVVMGEPHQTSTEQDGAISRAKIFQVYPKNQDGEYVPVLFTAQGANPTPMLSYSELHRVSGTAGPSFGSLNLYVETDGVNYLSASEDTWTPLEEEVVTYTWRGEVESFSVFHVRGYGEGYLRLIDPSSGTQYLITRRPKSARSPLDSFLNRLRYGATGDASNYEKTLRAGGLTKFGEAGCFANRRDESISDAVAYFVLNQGRTDILQGEESFQMDVVYPSTEDFKKVGSHDAPYCVGAWASADNGPLSGGCEIDPGESALVDPGLLTYRQQQFKDWYEQNAAQGELSESELLRFGSSTTSYGMNKFEKLFAHSIRKYGGETIPEEKQIVARMVADRLEERNGRIFDDPLQIGFFYMHQKFNQRMNQPNSPLSVFIFPFAMASVPISEVFELVTPQIAAEINGFLIDAIDFYQERCRPAGILKWSDLTRIVVDNKIVAKGFVGPNGGARNSGRFKFGAFQSNEAPYVRLMNTSPFSFTAFSSAIYYRTFGSNVSPHALESGLFETVDENAWKLISRINPKGVGFSMNDSYQKFSFSSTPESRPNSPVFRSLTLSLK